MPDQKFVLELETLIKLSTGDAIKQVEGLFAALRAEGERAIQASASTGSQAGLSHLPGLYTAAIGATSAYALNKPGITPAEQLSLRNAVAGAEDSYKGLQSSASEYELSLRNLTGLDRAHQSGSKLLNEALARQSRELELSRIATSERAGAEKVLTAAEKRAARQAELAEIRGQGTPAAVRYTVGGLGLTTAQLAAAQRGVTGEPDPTQSRYSLGGLGIKPTELVAINKNLSAIRNKEAVTEEESLREEARLALAKRARSAALARITREESISLGLGEGTFFQRLQAAVHSRGGFGGGGAGVGTDTRLPADFQSFGQFLTSKALTTGGFALSGAILYGAISGFKQITQEASALQRELAIVKGEFEKVGDTQGFQSFAKQVTQISVETGIAADQVALVARQLAGVFRDPTTGAADFTKALNETNVALKLSQVTGLSLQEVTDSMTAITTTLGSSFTTIGDLAIGLEQRFGVLAPQIIAFTADVAPVAKALGFTVEQISALGAIAQQRSGVSGSALAESFNRALPAIQQAGVKIAELFNQRPDTAKFTGSVLSALGQGQGATAIQELAKAYAVMTNNQRQALGELLGGPRAAKAFFAVLEAGTDTIDALNGKTGQYAGSLDQRFKDFQDTVSFAFEHARRALESFGLALFNSGLADGLKLIADTGGEVALVAGQLVKLFSELNTQLGGLPIKLLAIYATMKLLGSLGGGFGGVAALIGGVTGRGGRGGSGPQFESPYNAAAYAGTAAAGRPRFVPVTGAGLAIEKAGLGSGAGAALGGVVESLAPLIAAYAVAQFAQTVGTVNDQINKAQASLAEQVQIQLKNKVTPDEITRRASSAQAGLGGNTATNLKFLPSIVGDVALKVLSFGTVDTTSPADKELDERQKRNAPQQIKELEAIAKTFNDADRKRAEKLIALFKNDPANNTLNDIVARIIASFQNNPATAGALAEIAAESARTAEPVGQQKVNDYAPVLDEVQANYDRGTASLAELLDAERTQLANLRQTLATAGDNQQLRADTAKQLVAEQKKTDQIIDTAAKRAADITIKLAGLRGDNVVKTTADVALQTLRTKISQGASQDDILTAGLDALAAQQAALAQFVNSPVVVNGITRAPTAAEKIARAAAGLPISPELRAAVIQARLSADAAVKAGLVAASAQTNFGADDLIKQITQALIDSGQAEVDVLTTAIDKKIAEITLTLSVGFGVLSVAGEASLRKSLADLQAAKAALGNLPSIDPGHSVFQDVSDLTNQSAIDASTEAQALAQALIAQQRARAHGDPVAEAQASIAAAKQAIASATKPSERAAAIAQLIDGQNQLDDAQNAIIDARISSVATLLERGGDPVGAARQRVQLALRKVAEAKGEAAQIAAQDELLAAQQGVNDAIAKVFDAQAQLVSAIAAAAGDTVAVAKEALAVAQKHLADLAAAGRTDPKSDPEVAAALAAVATTEAGVRDAELNKRTQDIDIALQLEKITTAQAIAQFEALLQIPKLTTDETNAILIKIKSLKDSLSQDFANNIPSEIKLPTLYEVRRLNQVGTPGGPQSYQDNRQIQINLQAYNQGDLTAAVDTIVGVLDSRPRNGNRAGAYP